VQARSQGNRVKERMLNPIEQFVAHSGVWDSHGAKLWSAAQSLGLMLCVRSTTHSAADGSASIHPIALARSAPCLRTAGIGAMPKRPAPFV
jgi:hypothetical protein